MAATSTRPQRDVANNGARSRSFRIPPPTNFVILVCDDNGLPCQPPTLHITKETAPDKLLLLWSTANPRFQLQTTNALRNAGPNAFAKANAIPVITGGFEFSPLGDELAIASRWGMEFYNTATWSRTRTLTNFSRILYASDARAMWLTRDLRTAGLYDARTLEPLLILADRDASARPQRGWTPTRRQRGRAPPASVGGNWSISSFNLLATSPLSFASIPGSAASNSSVSVVLLKTLGTSRWITASLHHATDLMNPSAWTHRRQEDPDFSFLQRRHRPPFESGRMKARRTVLCFP